MARDARTGSDKHTLQVSHLELQLSQQVLLISAFAPGLRVRISRHGAPTFWHDILLAREACSTAQVGSDAGTNMSVSSEPRLSV